MRVTKNVTSKGTSFYIIRSVAGGSTEIVEKLGTEEEIKNKYHCEDALAWAKKRASDLTIQEKESQTTVMVPLKANVPVQAGKQLCFQTGYLFLQKIYYDLKLPVVCRQISRRYDFEYDLNEILSRLVYGRILFPCSKRGTMKTAGELYEKPGFEYHDMMRALSVLAEQSNYIQERLYTYSKELVPRKTSILYYDCTNFFFEIEEEKGIRKYGHSKENRPLPVVQMGLFMDRSGMPLAFTITDGNKNEQTTLVPLEKQILQDFGLSRFVVCTDSGLSSDDNRKFNNFQERSFITVQSIKKLKKERQDWCLAPDGWHLPGIKGTFDITKLEDSEEDRSKNYDKVFYKEMLIEGYDEERDISFNQTMFVTFSLKYRDYLRHVRNGKIERAKKMIALGGAGIEHRGQNDVRQYISRTSKTKDGKVATKDIYTLDEDSITADAKFDGFYAVCTNLDADIDDIIRVNKNRWEIEESFRIMKSEFDARPVYLQRDDRIRAHFLICFISLLLFRILEHKLPPKTAADPGHGIREERYTCEEIIQTLRRMKITAVGDKGYVPSYTRDALTDALHDFAGFRTDYEIMRKKYMQGVIRRSKGL